MNTILTDDERPKLPEPKTVTREVNGRDVTVAAFTSAQMEAYADAIEAAVLAKLREQEPVAWLIEYTDTGEREVRFVAGSRGDRQTPLYAAPQAPQAEQAARAMQLLTKALKEDADYAWSWHCNLAMPIMDATGVSHRVANEAAARLMQHFFNIDTAKHGNYRADAPQAEQVAPVRDERAALIAFLRGEGPLDGVWFGEPHPIEKGAFWWRKRLAALASRDRQPEVPAQWQEAVKVAREALDGMLQVHGVTQNDAIRHDTIPTSWVELSDEARAALAQLDSLGIGGKEQG